VPLAALALLLAGVLLPQRAGPVAAFAAIGPYACAGIVLLLTPLAALRRDLLLAAAVSLLGVVGGVAYHGSLPADVEPLPAELRIMTWNLHGQGLDAGLRDVMRAWQPDVVVLQEASLSTVEAEALFGAGMTVIHRPDAATPPGMVLATSLPPTSSGVLAEPADAWDRPRAPWVRVELDGHAITVVGVHLAVPFPVSSLPCPYCPSLRDAQVAALAAFAAARQVEGDAVLLAGDFNLTEREPAYQELGGLRDASSAATWRPLPLAWLPPLLRLDYVRLSPDLAVVGRRTACAGSSSDHCPLIVDLAFH
jgi:endonuclease/exonuclease/phosphatase family metal-dependent hydrolase